jgi:hypothetical protein
VGYDKLAELDVVVPEDYLSYVGLGRFRDAILRRRGEVDERLNLFAKAYGISSF